MLTGDKEETAINIGFSSGLLDNNIQRMIISSSKHDKLYAQLKEARDLQIFTSQSEKEYAIIVSGKAICTII